MLNVLILFGFNLVAMAVIKLESIPPLRNVPIGTSLMSCFSTEFSNSLINSDFTSLSFV